MTKQILIIDDDTTLESVLTTGLKKRGFFCDFKASAEEGLLALGAKRFDVVLTDLRLGGMDGLELCARIGETYPDTPVVLMTSYGDLEAAVSAIRAGAYDFITKPVELDVLVISLDRAIAHHQLREEVQRLRKGAQVAMSLENIVGDSLPMKRVCELVKRVANTEASVLITGETGTGKELVAQAVHNASERRDGPFLAINCAAVPENLLEDELFGHVHGAFTGSKNTRPGLFASARGGTLFLDEVGDMPLSLQPKLLRVLQEKRFRPVGSDREVDTDVRIIAATHRDLEKDTGEGRFRQDLFFRLAVVQVDVPSLRERGNDILFLAQFFLEKAATASNRDVKGISSTAAHQLLAYEWPGNVRELQNCIERAVVLARYDQITPEELPPKIQKAVPLTIAKLGSAKTELLPLDVIERRHILAVLERVGGKRGKAADVLCIDRKTLYRKLEGWGFNVEDENRASLS